MQMSEVAILPASLQLLFDVAQGFHGAGNPEVKHRAYALVQEILLIIAIFFHIQGPCLVEHVNEYSQVWNVVLSVVTRRFYLTFANPAEREDSANVPQGAILFVGSRQSNGRFIL